MTWEKSKTHVKGDAAEMTVASSLIKHGFEVSQPLSSGARYDFVAEYQGVFFRVQVKAAYNYGEGTFSFSTCSKPQAGSKKIQYKKQNIDIFSVYCFEKDNVYIVPIEEASISGMTLRYKKPKNNQKKRVNFVEDYVLKEWDLSSLAKTSGFQPESTGSNPVSHTDGSGC